MRIKGVERRLDDDRHFSITTALVFSGVADILRLWIYSATQVGFVTIMAMRRPQSGCKVTSHCNHVHSLRVAALFGFFLLGKEDSICMGGPVS